MLIPILPVGHMTKSVIELNSHVSPGARRGSLLGPVSKQQLFASQRGAVPIPLARKTLFSRHGRQALLARRNSDGTVDGQISSTTAVGLTVGLSIVTAVLAGLLYLWYWHRQNNRRLERKRAKSRRAEKNKKEKKQPAPAVVPIYLNQHVNHQHLEENIPPPPHTHTHGHTHQYPDDNTTRTHNHQQSQVHRQKSHNSQNSRRWGIHPGDPFNYMEPPVIKLPHRRPSAPVVEPLPSPKYVNEMDAPQLLDEKLEYPIRMTPEHHHHQHIRHSRAETVETAASTDSREERRRKRMERRRRRPCMRSPTRRRRYFPRGTLMV